jgi:hypothetical protein
MSDMAKELRERSLRAEQEGEPLALLDDAADEIDRLRLTDEERAAVDDGIDSVSGDESLSPSQRREIATSLRGLLRRLG